MSRVFLDTVGLLAVWNRRDQWHGIAKPVFTRLMERDTDYLTTPAVLLECGNAAAGIVDQISFAVMRRLGLTEAFSNDHHFQAAGFTLLF
jgi:predicted nucleic acid-binding protein